MLKIHENAIHCVNGKCIYPMQNKIKQNTTHNYDDLYGNQNYTRFNDLGVPLFVLQDEEPIVEETIHIQNDYVISDELYDKLFEKVEKKPKQGKKRNTKKKRKPTSGK